MTDKYDLTTARGVLMALADGHEPRSETSLSRLKVEGCHLVMRQDGRDRGADVVIRTEIRLLCSDEAWWQLAPKPVDDMSIQELARELYGDNVQVKQSPHDSACYTWSPNVLGSVSAYTLDALTKQLRVLVRAKRAGEL